MATNNAASSSHGWAVSDNESSDDDTSLLPQLSVHKDTNKKKYYKSPSLIKKSEKLTVATEKKYLRKKSTHLAEYIHEKNVEKTDGGECYETPPKKQKVLKESVDPRVVWHESSPLNFLLTTVSGIPNKHNYYSESSPLSSLHIRDILGKDFGDLIETVQFNYCINAKWFLEQLPASKRDIPILFVHGDSGADYSEINRSDLPNVKTCRVDLPMYGTHHTKMMFLRYPDGIRIVIHTANLVQKDWFQKTQGLWISPLFVSASSSTPKQNQTQFSFQDGLLEYVRQYKKHSDLLRWIDLIKNHDMSSAKVILIASVPGRHKDSDMRKWGHLKLAKVLASYVEDSTVSGWPVIGQFSSIGSLGTDKDKWVCTEWLKSLSSAKSQKKNFLSSPTKNAPLKLIFPTVENIRLSLEGYPSGASVPYSLAVAKKQLWLNNFLHRWKATHLQRSLASPHIKSYTRVSKDFSQAAWFLLTSANLSKAAWGSFEKKGTQLMIRSYELGVLFLPQKFYPDSSRKAFNLFGDNKNCDVDFTLPFSTPLTPYSERDEPWIWNIPYKHLPDRHGNMWVPS